MGLLSTGSICVCTVFRPEKESFPGYKLLKRQLSFSAELLVVSRFFAWESGRCHIAEIVYIFNTVRFLIKAVDPIIYVFSSVSLLISKNILR